MSRKTTIVVVALFFLLAVGITYYVVVTQAQAKKPYEWVRCSWCLGDKFCPEGVKRVEAKCWVPAGTGCPLPVGTSIPPGCILLSSSCGCERPPKID
jgi:hypothetical protein